MLAVLPKRFEQNLAEILKISYEYLTIVLTAVGYYHATDHHLLAKPFAGKTPCVVIFNVRCS
jgi:hypothetical protein